MTTINDHNSVSELFWRPRPLIGRNVASAEFQRRFHFWKGKKNSWSHSAVWPKRKVQITTGTSKYSVCIYQYEYPQITGKKNMFYRWGMLESTSFKSLRLRCGDAPRPRPWAPRAPDPATLQHGQRPQQLLWEPIVDSPFSSSSVTYYDNVRLNFERYGY